METSPNESLTTPSFSMPSMTTRERESNTRNKAKEESGITTMEGDGSGSQKSAYLPKSVICYYHIP